MKVKKLFNNKYFKLVIKILFTVVCFYLVFIKINIVEIGKIIKSADFLFILLATLFFILSKYLSAVRLQLFFNAIHLPISLGLNLRLYLLGMFYNLFLPGGIGGDGYKAYYLKRRNKDIPLRKIIQALLFDRINGFVVLGILALVVFYFIDFDFPYKLILIIAGIVSLLVLSMLVLYFFLREAVEKYFVLFVYSIGVQVSQFITALFIIFSLHISEHIIEMAFVFLISTITVMIPLTIGGTGIRELTFVYGEKYFHYNKDYSVTVAVLFFIITTLISLGGIYYSVRPDKLES